MDEALDEPGGCGLVETSTGCILSAPVDDVETALHARCREVPSGQREPAATGVAGDDVVDVVCVCGVRAGAARLENAETKIVVDASVGKKHDVPLRRVSRFASEGVCTFDGGEQ
jgi:hypothetical protein